MYEARTSTLTTDYRGIFGGITWTVIASTSLTNLNSNRAHVPTISSTDNFNMIKWDLTNTLGTVTQINHLDFIGDFYA
jgi:hypothetical protein